MNRRILLEAAVLGGLGSTLAAASPAAAETGAPRTPYVTAKDGRKLFVQDWGSGRPVLFLAAWTFNSGIWGSHIATLANKGYRCIAPDRRGHGRSEVPSAGYDLETLSDDVAAIMDQRALREVTLVAHSMGSIEAIGYLARHGSERVSKLVLAAPTTPFLVKTEDNPDAVPKAAIDAQNDAIARDFPKWMAANEAPFFLPDTPDITRGWIREMMLSVPLPVALACRRTISGADLRAAAGNVDRPTLIVQGDKDASAPLALTGVKTAKLIKGSKLTVYEGAPHALPITHSERFTSDLLAFLAT